MKERYSTLENYYKLDPNNPIDCALLKQGREILEWAEHLELADEEYMKSVRVKFVPVRRVKGDVDSRKGV